MKQYLGVKMVNAEPEMSTPKNVFAKSEDGYKVVYEDGYESWSPKEVFEKAYKEVDGLNFGLAIEAVKQGKCVSRKAWRGLFLCRQVPTEIKCEIIPKMTSLPQKAKDILVDRGMSLNYRNQLIIVSNSNTIDSWVASADDIFAEDWYIM